jgi:bacterioferritin
LVALRASIGVTPTEETPRRSGSLGRMSDRDAILAQLNKLLEIELSAITRYLHYSFMVFGANRIPITAWFRDQATEGMAHAILVGEKITAYGGDPTLSVRPVPQVRHNTVRTMLEESLSFERESVEEYRRLLSMAGGDVALEEFARSQILAETSHLEEVDKMLRGMPK